MKVLQVISGVVSHQFVEIYIKGHQQKLRSLSQQASFPTKHRFDIIILVKEIWQKANLASRNNDGNRGTFMFSSMLYTLCFFISVKTVAKLLLTTCFAMNSIPC